MNKPNEHPNLTPDRNVEAAVEGTFPASDPISTTASQGARAVPPAQMLKGADDVPHGADCATLSARFADAESAKLALETLVREGPIDRRTAEMHPDGTGVMLQFRVPQADAERVNGLLQQRVGAPSR